MTTNWMTLVNGAFCGGWRILRLKRGSEKVNNKMSFNLIWFAGLGCAIEYSTCTEYDVDFIAYFCIMKLL